MPTTSFNNTEETTQKTETSSFTISSDHKDQENSFSREHYTESSTETSDTGFSSQAKDSPTLQTSKDSSSDSTKAKQTLPQMKLERQETDSLTGMWGTANYEWNPSNGTLTVKEGDLKDGELAPYRNGTIDPTDILKIDFTAAVTAPLTSYLGIRTEGLFEGLSNMKTIKGLTNLDTMSVTNMSRMFRNASSLTSLDLSQFDTAKVTNMTAMFSGTSSLTSLDLSSFDTRNVTNMDSIFYSASSLANLNLSSFDTERVTSMNNMFYGTFKLNSLTLGKKFKFLSGAGLPSIQINDDYTGEWQNIDNGTETFPTGSNSWTSNDFMSNYDGSKDAGTYVWQPTGLNNWGTAPYKWDKSTGTLIVKEGDLKDGGLAPYRNGTIEPNDVKEIDFTGPVIAPPEPTADNKGLFDSLPNITSIDGLTYLNTRNVTSMVNMFANSPKLNNLKFGNNFDTSQVTEMWGMFYKNNSLTSLDISNFNMNSVTKMGNMFYGTSNLKSLTLGKSFKFLPDAGLPSIQINDGYTGKWQNIGNGTATFPTGPNNWTSNEFMSNYDGNKDAGTYIWQPKDVGLWGTAPYKWDKSTRTLTVKKGDLKNSNLAPYRNGTIDPADILKIDFTEAATAPTASSGSTGLFGNLNNMITIEGLKNLDTKNMVSMWRMFSNASSLTNLDLSSFDTRNVVSMASMFSGTSSLTSLNLTNFDTRKVTNMDSMFSDAIKLQSLTLGKTFKFASTHTEFPEPSNDEKFSGKWRNVSIGTPQKPLGENLWTSDELTTKYNGETDADQYVWQPTGMYINEVADTFSFPKVQISGEKQTVISTGKSSLSLTDALPKNDIGTQLLVSYETPDDDWQNIGLSLKITPTTTQIYVKTTEVHVSSDPAPIITQFDESEKQAATIVDLDLAPELTVPPASAALVAKDYSTTIDWTIQQGPS